MANGDMSFPKIATGNWWKLRDLFKRKVPTIVTPSYLANALSMEEGSAKSNIISPFKKIGILDEDGKPTDLAYDWRDDQKYAEVCSKIINNNYPEEIKDLFHSPDADYQQVHGAFMRQARCGEPAARMYATFYLLLLQSDPQGADRQSIRRETKPKNSSSPKPSAKSRAAVKPQIDVPAQSGSMPTHPLTPAPASIPSSPSPTVLANAPELHINIQLHISPESSAEQIDKIFESMARHLKDFNK
jgi:hypothetical protein